MPPCSFEKGVGNWVEENKGCACLPYHVFNLIIFHGKLGFRKATGYVKKSSVFYCCSHNWSLDLPLFGFMKQDQPAEPICLTPSSLTGVTQSMPADPASKVVKKNLTIRELLSN